MNPWPTKLPRSEIKDRDRVYPGSGAAPLVVIPAKIPDTRFRDTLSLVLLNVNTGNSPL